MKFGIHSNNLKTLLVSLVLILLPTLGNTSTPDTGFRNAAAGKYSVACTGDDCTTCENFCSQFGVLDQGKPAGLKGGTSWSSNDDEACTHLGVDTTGGAIITAPTATPGGFGKCGVQLSQDDLDYMSSNGYLATTDTSNSSGASAACSALTALRAHCLYRNSPVETYCTSINLKNSYMSLNIAATAIDSSALGACTLACVTLNPYSIGTCTALSLASGGMEIAAVEKMNTDSEKIKARSADILNGLGMVGGTASGLLRIFGKWRKAVGRV